MPPYPDKTEYLARLLQDVGCADDQAGRIQECIRAGDFATARLLLRRHRSVLLDNLHQSQDRIDCLDFIVYQMDKIQQTKNRKGCSQDGRTETDTGVGQDIPQKR